MDAAVLIVAALAAARIAQLLIRDDFGPLRDLRQFIHARWPGEDTRFLESVVTPSLDPAEGRTVRGLSVFRRIEDGYEVWLAADPHPFGMLWECIRCMSVWAGLFVTVLWAVLPAPVLMVVLGPFAVSQVAITITRGE